MADKPEEKMEDIPAWFMTYSDVITLLMTFFILLLTFATNEPEYFERLQVTFSSSGGATGVAGEVNAKGDRDSFVMRERPRSGRLAMSGSEMPPVDSNPSLMGVESALGSLKDEEDHDMSLRREFDIPLNRLMRADGSMTATGDMHLRMLARQLRKDPFHVTLTVKGTPDIDSAVTVSQALAQNYGILPGKIGISHRNVRSLKSGTLRIQIVRQLRETR